MAAIRHATYSEAHSMTAASPGRETPRAKTSAARTTLSARLRFALLRAVPLSIAIANPPAVRIAGRWLSDRAPWRLPRRVGPRRRPRPRRPRQRAAERLADDPHRRCFGDLAQRHGCVPGRAPGAGRDAVLQVRACDRARPPHPVLCRDGGQELDLWPSWRELSRHCGRHHYREGRRVEGGRAGALPGSATHPGDAG